MTVYVKTAWITSTAPGISAGNLNNLETQYDCFVSSYSTNTPLPDSTTPTTGTSSYWSQGDHTHSLAGYFLKSSASATLQYSNDSTATITSNSPQVLKSFTVPPQLVAGSVIRVSFDMTGEYSGQTRGWVGGALSGTTHLQSATSWTTYTEDVTMTGTAYPQYIYLYGYKEVVGSTYAYVANFRIYGDTTAAPPASSWG